MTVTLKMKVLNYNGKILIDFWAEWCGPCKMMTPVFQELEKSFNNIKFCKINVDECSALAERFGVMSIPTFILFENGKADKANDRRTTEIRIGKLF